jgi:hypothetical protein
MGKPNSPRRVKLIIGMLAKDEKLFDSIEKFFVKKFGQIDYKSPLILFDYTNYYKKEMGWPLQRRFVSFAKLISPEQISKIKNTTNDIERKYAVLKDGSFDRRINLDPGYVCDSKLVLATTKDYYHRIYLDKGIYAEITLVWKKGGFQPFEWTYPDYRSGQYINVFTEMRNQYLRERENRER